MVGDPRKEGSQPCGEGRACTGGSKGAKVMEGRGMGDPGRNQLQRLPPVLQGPGCP